MGWLQQIGGLLQQYAGTSPQLAPPSAYDDYDRVAQQAPPEALAQGIASAFRSDQTPPFAQMVGQMFGQADPQQRAGLLNTIAGAVGPRVLEQAFGSLFGGGQVDPQRASRIPPDMVQQAAEHAERENPGVVDQVSGFFSQHPRLLGTVGPGALAAAMSGMSQGYQGGVMPASRDPYGDPADQAVYPASQDPYGDPADRRGGGVASASEDPYGDPAELEVVPASQDPYGDPADRRW